jgi:hypothetical protein
MTRHMIVGSVLALLAAEPAAAAALDPYVGKNVFEKVRGRAVYQLPEVKQDFVAKFGERRWRTLLTYQTSAPIEAVEDASLGRVIVTWQCKPHDCPNQATLVLRANGETVGACFAGDDGAEWLGPGWRTPARENDCGTEGTDIVARFKAAAARAKR